MGSKLILLLIISTCSSCSVLRKSSMPLNDVRYIQCVGKELDGSVTLIATGSGRNKRDALSQAKKNALHQVIFIGTDSKNNTCLNRPLVGEVNAIEKYAGFFNEFFKDKGEFMNYVSRKDERLINKFNNYVGKNKYEVTFSVTLRVKVPELTNLLKTNSVIK
jgi:hypothetical protein